MKALFVAFLSMLILSGCRPVAQQPEKIVAQTLCQQLDTLNTIIQYQLIPAVNKRTTDSKDLQQLFLRVRLSYKHTEWAVAYFTPGAERLINGAPVPEVERSGQVREPGGLQVIESELFPLYQPSSQKAILSQLVNLQSAIHQSRLYFQHVPLLDWQIWEASKLEVFRILTLGITGFDNPLAENSMPEAASALTGMKKMLIQYDQNSTASLNPLLTGSIIYLERHSNFNSFDRAAFTTQFGNPLSKAIFSQQCAAHIKPLHYGRLLRQNAGSLFDKAAFDPAAFEAEPSEKSTPQNVALGKRLFRETLLSGPITRSCASCHQPDKEFSDGLVVNTNIVTGRPLMRRTPTLINAALQPAQFTDMRAITLEQQIADVISNPSEMNGMLDSAAKRLTKAYRQPLTPVKITSALGDYVRSLSLLNSRFDNYMRGNATAMNQQEITGFNLFMGKAKCGTCHYMPLFNGALPPYYERMDAEVIGVPEKQKNLDSDMGQFSIIPVQQLAHAFKTPTLRNTALLSHFMHNGVFNSLNQVLDFYNKGGGVGMGLQVPNQTLSTEPLKLTKSECKAIIAFINSLNSKLPEESANPVKPKHHDS